MSKSCTKLFKFYVTTKLQEQARFIVNYSRLTTNLNCRVYLTSELKKAIESELQQSQLAISRINTVVGSSNLEYFSDLNSLSKLESLINYDKSYDILKIYKNGSSEPAVFISIKYHGYDMWLECPNFNHEHLNDIITHSWLIS